MIQKLFKSRAVASLILCIAIGVFWIRSYSGRDVVGMRVSSREYHTEYAIAKS